ncbi:hypothetical protein GCM10022253_04210 [Sphingomonas endophytica]
MSVGRVIGVPTFPRRKRPGMLLLALLCLWSLVCDGIAVGAHHHAAPQFVGAQLQTAAPALDEPCALCGAATTLEALLLPSPPGWHVPFAAVMVVTGTARRANRRRSLAHGWRSRAPPGTPAPR